jgi:hypothetical protein
MSGLASERAEQRKLNDEELRDALAEFRIAHGLPQRFQRLEPRSSLGHTHAHAFLSAGDPPPRHRQLAVFASMGRSDFSTEVEPSCSCLWLTVASNTLCKGLVPSIDHSCSTYRSPPGSLRGPKLVLSSTYTHLLVTSDSFSSQFGLQGNPRRGSLNWLSRDKPNT